MKSLQHKSQVHVSLLVMILDILVWIQTPTAQLSLSTPTGGVQCYGDPVTLVCTHPVLPNDEVYLFPDVGWRRNGTGVRTSDSGFQVSTGNSTTTRLQFTITNLTAGNYTCFLVYAGQGGIVKSNSVPVIPLDLTPPVVTNIDPFESNITVEWTPQHCAVRYNVSWNYTNDDGTTTTGSGVSDQVTNYTIPTSVQGVYTVSVQAVDGVGNVGPATSEVVRSTYPRPTANATPCEDRLLLLKCLASGQHTDRRSHFMWIDRNSNLTNSTLYTITGPELMIANVSALSVEEDKAIRCCEVLNNGIIVEGVEYKVEPLAQPGPPEVTITTTDSTITLTWNTTLRCFESEMFTFVVIWNEIGSGTSTNVTTSSSPYTISGLQPGTSYQISVQGVGGSGVVGGTAVLSVSTPAETPTEGGDLATAVAIAVVAASVIILVAVVIAIILVVAHCRKRRVQGDYDAGSSTHDPIPSASSKPFSSRLSGTCCYAEVDFERNPPTTIPPPPLERVTYADPVAVVVGEKESETNDGGTKPDLPTKQPPRHNIEFRSDVVDALVSIGVNFFGVVETGGAPHFTAEYNNIHFVVTCMYTSSDVTLEDVGHVVEAKQATGSTKGLLLSNQSTIPSECLLTLEGAGCQFVPVSGYGEEGWEDRMIDKFKDVFPKVANDHSKSEDLLTSEQETSPPPSGDQSSVIQQGTGPAPVQFNNSNNNNIVDKRWTLPDEHCVESREETPPRHNDCSTSTFRGPEDEELTTIVKTAFYTLDDQNVKGIFSGVANDDSESEDLRIPEQVVDYSPMVLPNCPPPTKTTPPPDYQGGYSGVTSDDSKTHDDPFRSPPGDTIVSAQYSLPMASLIHSFPVSPFEYKLSDDEEVLHKRVPQVEVMVMPVQVLETPLTTCPPPSTAASIANLEYPKEPLPTAASVASGECPKPLPIALTESSHEYPDVLKADDSNISPEQTPVSYEHTDVNDMETWFNSKMEEAVSDCVCMSSECQICCAKESSSSKRELIPSELATEECKDSIQSTEFPPAKQTSQYSEKIHGCLARFETVDHFRNKSFNYSCLLVLAENGQPSGDVQIGENVTVDPVDSPKKPHNVTLVPGVTSISGSLEHDKSCFEDHTFEFNVTWQEVGTTNESWSVVNGTNFTIQGLKPGTKYNICTSAVSTSDKQVKSEQECQIIKNEDNTTASPGPGGDNPTSIAVAAIVPPKVMMDLLVVTTVIAGVLLVAPTVDVVGLMDVAIAVAVGLLVVHVLIAVWQLFRRRQHEVKRKVKKLAFLYLSVKITQMYGGPRRVKIPTPVSQEQNDSSELVSGQGCCRAIRDQPRTASQRTTTNYPELDFNADIEVDSSILTVPLYKGEDLTTSKLVASPPPDDDRGGSSGVADNDSEREYLLASPVEETSPLPDNYIKVGLQGEDLPTPLQATTLPSADQYCTITLRGHGTKGAKDYSESEDHQLPVQETTPPDNDWDQICISGVANDYKKPLNDQFRITQCDSITTSAQCMPSDIGRVLFSPFEYQLHDEEEEICHERGMSTSVHETPLTMPSTTTSITNLECPEEPLSTAISVASGEGPDKLPIALTQSSYERPNVLKADDSNINHELDSVSHEHTDVNNVQTLANSKIPEVVSDCVCMSSGCQICCAKESRSSKKELISSELATEEGKNSIQSIEFPPAKQTSTHNEKIYSYFGRPETGQNPLQWQQNLRMLPVNKTESLQCTPKRTDVFYNDRGQSYCMFVPWLAYLYEAVLHHVGALLVRWQIVGMNIAPY